MHHTFAHTYEVSIWGPRSGKKSFLLSRLVFIENVLTRHATLRLHKNLPNGQKYEYFLSPFSDFAKEIDEITSEARKLRSVSSMSGVTDSVAVVTSATSEVSICWGVTVCKF